MIELIEKIREFKKLKDDWNKLLQNCDNNNIFLTWEWLYSWWLIFKKKSNLYVIIIKENNELIGIAPFYLKTESFFFSKVKSLEFLGNKEVCSDYLDFIVQKGKQDIFFNKLFDFLCKNNQWDFIKLTDIPEKSKTVSIISEMYDDFIIKKKNHTICPYIILPSNPEDFLKRLGRETRYKISKCYNKLVSDYNFSIKTVNDKSTLKRSVEMMIKLNKKRWKKNRLSGTFYSNDLIEFYKLISRKFFDKGWLRFDFVLINGKMVAYCYDFIYNKKTYGYSTSYDPHLLPKNYSVGSVLQTQCIKRAIKEQCEEFDMLRGTSSYKYRFTKEQRSNLIILIGKNKLKNKLYLLNNITKEVMLNLCRIIVPQKIRLIIGDRIMRKKN